MAKGKPLTADGLDLIFGTNFIGHFALTMELMPLIESTPRSRCADTIPLIWRCLGAVFMLLLYDSVAVARKSRSMMTVVNLCAFVLMTAADVFSSFSGPERRPYILIHCVG